ncbi:unnamed protein product, partial [Rotaria sp. Silwood1]
MQHTTSSYVLAKFALAQLIDDIDFRILTYLEQQQQLKQQYADIRVRQATASTFAKQFKIICLNDNNARVIHVSLNALRTLLPFLLINSHASTIIGIELLKDSIQHSTSSCILAKFALAQLMNDIDFRTLTYLEQQLKQQYPDIRVRQAIASTFA